MKTDCHVQRSVHPAISNRLSDEQTRILSLQAIACYREIYGTRKDKEFSLCVDAGGLDVWCVVRCRNRKKWQVTLLPEKEAQQYMSEWEEEDSLPPISTLTPGSAFVDPSDPRTERDLVGKLMAEVIPSRAVGVATESHFIEA